MNTSNSPEPPTMSGYLEYKSRAAAGEYAIPNEATRAWMDEPNAPKPALMQYEEALVVEQDLQDKGAYDPATRARLTGLKMQEFKDSNQPGTRDELLFRAKRAVDIDLSLSHALSVFRREEAIENSTPILNRVIRTAEAMRNNKQTVLRTRLTEKMNKRGRDR